MDDRPLLYRWDHFEARPAARVLRRDGVDSPLEPKAYDVLVYLIKHRDRVVSKDELLDALWPGRVVGDATVNQCLLKIRQAIDEDRTDSVIQTVRGRGFRFRPAVTIQNPANAKAAVKFKRHHMIMVALALSAGIALLAWSGLMRESTWSEPSTFAVMRFTNLSDERDQDWLELGLMSLVSDSLSDYPELNIVPSGTVARLSLNAPGDPNQDERTQLLAGIDARYILSADVESLNPGYRLHYTLWDDDEPIWRNSLDGLEVADLVSGLTGAVGDHLSQGRREPIPIERLSRITFVNELFARGRQASLEGDYGQALRYLELALKEDPGLLYAKDDFARTLRLQGQLERSRTVTEEVIAQARSRGDRVVEGSAISNLGTAYWRLGDHAKAEELVTKALSIHQTLDDRIEAANDLNLLGIITGQQNRPQEAQDHYDAAMTLFQAAGDRRGIAKTYNNMAYLAGSQRDDRRSLELNLLALDIHKELHLTGSVALTLNNLGASSEGLGEFAAALDYYKQALAMRIELEDMPGQATSLGNVGTASISLGKTDEAIKLTRQAVELAQKLESPRNEAIARIKLGEALSGSPDVEAARSEFVRAKQLFSSLGLEAGALEATLYQADLEQRAGKTADSQATLTEAGTMLKQVDQLGLASWHQCIQARLYLEANNGPAALAAIEKGMTLAMESGDERTLAELAIEGVWLSVRSNDLVEARRYLQKTGPWQREFFPAITAAARVLYGESQYGLALEEQDRAKALAGAFWSDSMEAYRLAYQMAADQSAAVILPEHPL